MLRRAVIVLLLAAATGLLVWGGIVQESEPPASAVDSAVEELIPGRDSVAVPRQARIGVDLAPTWTGVLLLDGLEIPEDQLDRNAPLNQFYFQPGEGKEIERLSPGRVVATAIIWRPTLGESRGSGSRSFSWAFTVS